MSEKIASINSVVNSFIWGVPAMICIIGVGILLTVRTRCIQVRKFGVAMKNTIGKIFDKTQARDGSMSPFQEPSEPEISQALPVPSHLADRVPSSGCGVPHS